MSRRTADSPRRVQLGVSLALLTLLAVPATAQRAKPSGAEVWGANCGRCHRLRAVDAYNASQWDAVVTHMALTARLTPDETEAVRQFLVGAAEARQANSRPSESAPLPAMALRNASLDLTFGAPLEPACPQAGGAEIYQAQCTVCHGTKGKGDGPAAAGLKPRPPDLSDSVLMAKLSDDSLVKVLTGGRKAMPGFGKILKPEDVRRVAAFVRCLGQSERPGKKTGN